MSLMGCLAESQLKLDCAMPQTASWGKVRECLYDTKLLLDTACHHIDIRSAFHALAHIHICITTQLGMPHSALCTKRNVCLAGTATRAFTTGKTSRLC